MNDTEYLKKLIKLTDELQQHASIRPYDPAAYNAVIDQLNAHFDSKGKRRRRRPWAAVLGVLFLLLILIYIVFMILHDLKIMDSQS